MSKTKRILILSKEGGEVNQSIKSHLQQHYDAFIATTIGDFIYRFRREEFDVLLYLDPLEDELSLVVEKSGIPEDYNLILASSKHICSDIPASCKIHQIGFPIDYKEFEQVHNSIFSPVKPKKKILIIEDEKINQEIILSILTSFKCEIAVADDSIQALKEIQENKPDIILLDFMLPRMNADQLLYWIRGRHSKEDLPVLVISSQEEKENVLTMAKLGVEGYLVKPFNREQFIEKVSKLINSP